MQPKNKWLGRPRKHGSNRTFAGQVGQLLRQARTARHLTLKELEERTGGEVSFAMISQYERGQMEPRLSSFLALCLALGLPFSELLPEEMVRRLKI